MNDNERNGGSAKDRDLATRSYTGEGNFDMVGNNMPVLFIQAGINRSTPPVRK